MKKILALILVFILAFAFAGCKKKDAEGALNSSVQSDTVSVEFVKPENYASVILITINPQIRLYLDEGGKVLAVEPVNTDAVGIIDANNFVGKNLKVAVEEIVTVANEKGFIKENVTVNISVDEAKNESVNVAELLSTAKQATNDAASKLEVAITVNEVDNTVSTESNVADRESSEATPSVEEHTHVFSGATCTKAATCTCGATNGNALGHNYVQGVCSRCNSSDPNFKFTSVKTKVGRWTYSYVTGYTLNDAALTLYGTEISGGGSFGDDIRGMSDIPAEDIENFIKPECTVFEGQYYYVARGTGPVPLSSVTESGNTVTVKDTEGNSLVLTRISETTMKVTSSTEEFSQLEGKVPVGLILTFKGE